jgi:hypothetical protein
MCVLKRTFYQDRLGTNIRHRETQEQDRFFAGHCGLAGHAEAVGAGPHERSTPAVSVKEIAGRNHSSNSTPTATLFDLIYSEFTAVQQ